MELPTPDPSPLSLLPLPSPPFPPPSPDISSSMGRKRSRSPVVCKSSPQPKEVEEEEIEADTPVITSSSLEVEVASSIYEANCWRNDHNHPSSLMTRWMTQRPGNEKSVNNTLDYRLSYFDEDSDTPIDDFDPSEWTPQDSSYGAAIPIGGWIPKGIRRNIELCVSVILLALIGYLIITTSMRAERSKHDDDAAAVYKNGGTINSKGLDLDDDRYINNDNGSSNKKNNKSEGDEEEEDEEQEFDQDMDDMGDDLGEGQGNRLLWLSLDYQWHYY